MHSKVIARYIRNRYIDICQTQELKLRAPVDRSVFVSGKWVSHSLATRKRNSSDEFRLHVFPKFWSSKSHPRPIRLSDFAWSGWSSFPVCQHLFQKAVFSYLSVLSYQISCLFLISSMIEHIILVSPHIRSSCISLFLTGYSPPETYFSCSHNAFFYVISQWPHVRTVR